MNEFLNKIEKEITEGALSILNIAHLILMLKVMEDRLWHIDNHSAQKCNDLQHILLGEKVNKN